MFSNTLVRNHINAINAILPPPIQALWYSTNKPILRKNLLNATNALTQPIGFVHWPLHWMSCISSVSVVVFVFVRNKMKIVKVDPNNEILLTISKHDFVFNTLISLNGISWINWINCPIAGIEMIGQLKQHIKAHLHCSAKHRKSKLENHKVTALCCGAMVPTMQWLGGRCLWSRRGSAASSCNLFYDPNNPGLLCLHPPLLHSCLPISFSPASHTGCSSNKAKIRILLKTILLCRRKWFVCEML